MLENQLSSNHYWKRKISNKEPITGSDHGYEYAEISLSLNDSQNLNEISRGNSLSKLAIVTSVFSILMDKYFENYQNNLIVYPSDVIGLDNVVLLQLKSNKNSTFKNHLKDVGNEVSDTFIHGDYDTDKIRLDSFSAFSIQFGKEAELKKESISLRYLEFDNQIVFSFFFKPEYPIYVIKSFLKNLHRIVSNYRAFLDTKLSHYCCIDDDEKQQLIFDFNNTEVSCFKGKTIVNTFESRVKEAPNNLAVYFNDNTLTYSQLNEKANQLAYYIQSNYQIAKGEVIGVFLPKSEIGVISFLAILKLNAVYLPIDIHYPQDRINYIIQDSNLKILITNNPEYSFSGHTVIDVQSIDLDKINNENLEKDILANDLAYIIYTSGSTGLPKGVMIEHSGTVNMASDQISSFKITERDKVVWFSSVSFDASISEIMMCLGSGAMLCIPKEGCINDKDMFVKFLNQTKSTVVTLPPSYLGLLSQHDISGLRCIITAGESAQPSRALDVVKSGIDYFNAYGPTECTVCVSIYKVTPNDACKSIIPIGKPIANTQVYILDESLLPLPIGVSGKLHVSGVGLAAGYLNNQRLTEEKFVQNPFLAGKRMYDTGDVGRWLPDGNIEFLGRKDNQVKLRGHRIELGEIENTVLQFSSDITQVVADIREHRGDKILIVYFVTSSAIDNSLLRVYMSERLPQYMLPGFYVALKKLPYTPNGKIDRKALPSAHEIASRRLEYVSPSTRTEEVLATIWQEILGVEKIGVTDNFFELGGHSLMILQIINRIREKLEKTINFRTFFTNPTILALSKKLHESEFEPIPRSEVLSSYPVTKLQNSIWVLSQSAEGSLAYHMPAIVKLNGFIDFEKFNKSFQMLLCRHEILRTYFKPDDLGVLHQYIVPYDQISFRVVEKDFSRVENQKEAISLYLNQVSNEVFDLENVPLIRASLITLKENNYIFFLSLHHIISDGWSIELLIQEVVETYNNLIAGINPNLPELVIQYKDYAVWLDKESKNEKYTLSKQYWLKKFEGTLPVLKIPGIKNRPSFHSYNGSNLSRSFSKEFTNKLYAFSKEQGVTLFMTLMTGINVLLHKYSGQDDIIIGTPVAGRKHPDLENQLGLYLNTLAIRTQFNRRDTFLDFLSSQKNTLLEAYEHQNYQFVDLVDDLNLKRDVSRSVLFDVWVVLQSQNRLRNINTRKMKGIAISNYNFPTRTSKFDIMFNFSEMEVINLDVTYNSNIYDELFIEKIFGDIENLLCRAIESPRIKINELADVSQNLRENNVRKLTQLLK